MQVAKLSELNYIYSNRKIQLEKSQEQQRRKKRLKCKFSLSGINGEIISLSLPGARITLPFLLFTIHDFLPEVPEAIRFVSSLG